MKLQALRGMKDLLPEDFLVADYIINQARQIGHLYGYQPIATPILEYTKVFDRTLGDTSDVVSKEMYSFLDRSNESISMRPEFTAGVVRAFVENMQHRAPIKLFSSGPLFRYDRPQAGRQRQFHQVNFEYIGAEGAHTDAEVIKLAYDVLRALKVKGCTLEINSLGCMQSRASYGAALKQFFHDHKKDLSEDSARRLDKNPMRILDSKDEGDKRIVNEAPLLSEFYTEEARNYFTKVLGYLKDLGVEYTVNQKLVRGLDYYCHTAFEFVSHNPKLGSQSSVLGGGRYDGLVKMMGGGDISGIGFGAGIERLAIAGEYDIKRSRPTVVMPIEENNITAALQVAARLRQENIETIMEVSGKIGKRMERALQAGSRYVIFIGEEEERSQSYKLKDLDKREEFSCALEQIVQYCKKGG